MVARKALSGAGVEEISGKRGYTYKKLFPNRTNVSLTSLNGGIAAMPFSDEGMVRMFHALKKIFAAAMFAGAMGTASFAATIPFTINTAGSSATISNCDDFLCVANVSLAPGMAGNPILNPVVNGPAVTFDFLRLTAVVDLFGPDSFTINATLAFLSPLTGVTGTGSGTGFTTTGGIITLARFTNGVLTWDPIAPVTLANGATYRVSFSSPPPSAFGAGSATDPRSVIIQASLSVVPLPAGILLLGTALLGLFGLSRRRKLAAA